MATANRNTLFNSPVDLNFYGYRIVDNASHQVAANVTVGFKYRGHEIAFSTFNPSGAKIIVLKNGVLIDECGTVEAAVASVNERTEERGWVGAGAGSNAAGRQAARRGSHTFG